MADIPRAQPLPQLGPIQPQGIGAGLASGLEAGANMGYKAQQIQLETKRQAVEQQKAKFEMEQATYKNAQSALERVAPLYDSAPRGTQPALWAFTKKQLMILNPDLQLPDSPPPSGVGKDLGYFLEQNRQWHESGGKKGLNDADAHFGASQYLATESPKWATVDQSILNSSPLGANKTPISGGPGKPPGAFNPSAGDITPLPGGTPTTSGMPGGTSPIEIDRPLQNALLQQLMPIHQSLASAHAVTQFAKVAANDSTGASDWPLLENAAVALNPKLAQTIDQVGGLNQQTAPSLMKSGGLPELITGYIQSMAGGAHITSTQRDAIVKMVNTAANMNRVRANSLIQGFSQVGSAQGGDPSQIVTPIIDALPENVGNTPGQDTSGGAALAHKHMSLIPGAVAQ